MGLAKVALLAITVMGMLLLFGCNTGGGW